MIGQALRISGATKWRDTVPRYALSVTSRVTLSRADSSVDSPSPGSLSNDQALSLQDRKTRDRLTAAPVIPRGSNCVLRCDGAVPKHFRASLAAVSRTGAGIAAFAYAQVFANRHCMASRILRERNDAARYHGFRRQTQQPNAVVPAPRTPLPCSVPAAHCRSRSLPGPARSSPPPAIAG